MTFSVKDTNFAKGVAICMILFHHLFYQSPSYGISIGDFSLVHKMALFSRVAVATFIMLSGFGLAESLKRNTVGLLKFYSVRFFKIYSAYWLVLVLFVPIGVFYFQRPLESAYMVDIEIRFVQNLFGLQYFFISGDIIQRGGLSA